MEFQTIFNFFALIIMSMCFHELGHITYCWLIGKKSVLKFVGMDMQVETKGLTNKQYINVLVSGIVNGGVIVFLGLFFLSKDLISLLLNIVVLVIYFFYGIKSDMQKIRELEKLG